jgi:hypothetical protein
MVALSSGKPLLLMSMVAMRMLANLPFRVKKFSELALLLRWTALKREPTTMTDDRNLFASVQ